MLFLLQIRCSACGATRPMIPEGVLHWLRDHGRLLREEKPSNDLLLEMARLVSSEQGCDECGALGLVVEPPDDDEDADWGDSHLCESCKSPIDPLRLEVFPDTRICVECQGKEEQGGGAEADYCPSCGAILSIRTRSSGSGYQQHCSDCGYRS